MGVVFGRSDLQAELVERRRAIKARLFQPAGPARPKVAKQKPMLALVIHKPEPLPEPEPEPDPTAKEIERQRIEAHMRENYPEFLAWRDAQQTAQILSPRFATIVKVVAEEFGVSVADILSERRLGNIVPPRHVAMYFGRTLTKASLPTIGRWLGGRDHATILHGVRKIETLIRTDHDLAERVAKIKRQLLGEPEPPDDDQFDLPFDWRLRRP